MGYSPEIPYSRAAPRGDNGYSIDVCGLSSILKKAIEHTTTDIIPRAHASNKRWILIFLLSNAHQTIARVEQMRMLPEVSGSLHACGYEGSEEVEGVLGRLAGVMGVEAFGQKNNSSF